MNMAHMPFAMDAFPGLELGVASRGPSEAERLAAAAVAAISRSVPREESREGRLAGMLAHAKAEAGGGEAEAVKRVLAETHGVETRCVTALGGGENCLRTLRWTYLEHDGLILEPRFRESFAIASPTPQFAEVLAAVPEEFVGSARRLTAIVEVVCEQIRLSFQAQGLPVPPWRQPSALASKWFPPPSRCRRSSCPAPTAAAGMEHAAVAQRDRAQSQGRTTSPISILDDPEADFCMKPRPAQPTKHAAHWSPAAPLEGCTVRGGVQFPQCSAALMCGYGGRAAPPQLARAM